MWFALLPLLLICYPVIDGDRSRSEQRAEREIRNLLENYTFTIRDDYVDKNITAFLESEMRYNAARNALRNKLAYSEQTKADVLINAELEKIKNKTKKTKEPKPIEVLLEGRQSLFMACFASHMTYVTNYEKASCTGAKEFAKEVCSEFRTCMRKRYTSFWMCKPKICSKFKKMPKHPHCYDYLFKCD